MATQWCAGVTPQTQNFNVTYSEEFIYKNLDKRTAGSRHQACTTPGSIRCIHGLDQAFFYGQSGTTRNVIGDSMFLIYGDQSQDNALPYPALWEAYIRGVIAFVGTITDRWAGTHHQSDTRNNRQRTDYDYRVGVSGRSDGFGWRNAENIQRVGEKNIKEGSAKKLKLGKVGSEDGEGFEMLSFSYCVQASELLNLPKLFTIPAVGGERKTVQVVITNLNQLEPLKKKEVQRDPRRLQPAIIVIGPSSTAETIINSINGKLRAGGKPELSIDAVYLSGPTMTISSTPEQGAEVGIPAEGRNTLG
ncbi:hypothetical protein B0H13DRAFT_2288531 [Mycena leptocephala]|nr:hypothetical protein B0H13DRAFT_2288531 [Mycena leptocephala]